MFIFFVSNMPGRIYTMRGPRLFDHTDWRSKKKFYTSSHVLFSVKISVKSKKKGLRVTFSDVPFSPKISLKSKKKVFAVRDEAPLFLRGPNFSLLSLHVNPALATWFQKYKKFLNY